jgi:hypothetical protein
MRSENSMSVRRFLIRLALALLAAGCSDKIGPQPLAQAPRFLQWAGPFPPQFSAVDTLSGRGRDGVRLASAPSGLSLDLAPSPSGLSLDKYATTFWAVRGQQRAVQVNYLSFTRDTTSPFLRLASVDPSYVPGRGNLAPGDSVLITVTIDRYDIKVSLEPTGLRFDNPAGLRIWYGGAGGDMNGDGLVNAADATIEHQLLGMWYREGADTLWTKITAAQSLGDKSFTSALQHFSEYAVCW